MRQPPAFRRLVVSWDCDGSTTRTPPIRDKEHISHQLKKAARVKDGELLKEHPIWRLRTQRSVAQTSGKLTLLAECKRDVLFCFWLRF